MRDVIIACDFKNKGDLISFLKNFEGMSPYLKVGMELYYAEGPSLIKELKEKGFKIFLDLKLHDIPNTVGKAMSVIAKLGVEITNVHAAGGIKMMEAAKKAIVDANSNTKLIAVTQLTSIDQTILEDELLIKDKLADVVYKYAENAKKANLDGIVCSAFEAEIANKLGLISVTPGIRFQDGSVDDQKRVATPELAKELGSTYIVVGRAITDAKDPKEAYLKACKEFI